MLEDCNKYMEEQIVQILKNMEEATGLAIPDEYKIWFRRGAMFGVSAAGKMLASIDTSKSL